MQKQNKKECMSNLDSKLFENCIKNYALPIWKDKLTDTLINSVRADDGVLLHLSTNEYEHLFDWNRVCREVRVVHPLFYIRHKDGSLKIQAVWAKSCRGAMVRFILQHLLTTPDELKAFSYEGFEYAPQMGEGDFPHYVREF